jgi:hypothetical protein
MSPTDGSLVTDHTPLTMTAADVSTDPFPHVIKDGFLDADLYRRLEAEFPPVELFEAAAGPGGRAGLDLYQDDPQYEEMLAASPAWREFYEFINSQRYVDALLDLFGAHFATFDCRVDPAKARFSPYVEPRQELAEKSRLGRKLNELQTALAPGKNVNDLFVRLDLALGSVGYGKPVHCDRPNRLSSMLIYFCDADDIEMDGGELLIHRHKQTKPYRDHERHPKAEDLAEIERLRAHPNRGVFFLSSNNSYHSATEVKAQRDYRRFVYISISSRAKRCW